MKPFTSSIPKQDCQKQVHINSSDNWSRIPALNPAAEQGCWPHTRAGLATWAGLGWNSNCPHLLPNTRNSGLSSQPELWHSFVTKQNFPLSAHKWIFRSCTCFKSSCRLVQRPGPTRYTSSPGTASPVPKSKRRGEDDIKSIRTEVTQGTDTWILHSSDSVLQ